MIRSKVVAAARIFGNQGVRQFSTTGPKLSGGPYFYREFPMAPKFMFRWADVGGIFMWWWIWWHIFTDYGHLIGHFEFPQADKWTDEELGIPSEDEGIYESTSS